ncbi:MAG TPA: alanine racemase [Stackebrandtia sp.]|uniref:alanine racemase n=1 Tax=Stackebrandtia sp. TaxID=2023065 RepID=UPI002D2C040B|nr:alanine racemase [Stackebrandtia sp.]HZE41041.1 alanine racemase [Stackebrandtia sp.]
MSFQAEAVVDLDTIAANVAALDAHTSARVMAVVKANAYGHGLVPTARACLAGGAAWLGCATLDEALALRAAGITAPVLAWLLAPGLDLASGIDADIDLAATSIDGLREIAEAPSRRPARVHLKADTGMGRGGVPAADWSRFVELAAKAQADARIEVVGACSHLACADEPDHPANAAQRAAFAEFLDAASDAGLRPSVRHLANSAATLIDPDSHYDLVRPGIAVYGYPPVDTPVTLRPALSLRARLVAVKRLPSGHGVGYGHIFVTDHETTVGLAPLGYADGVPRGVSGRGARVLVEGQPRPILGRVSMDQVVIDVDGTGAREGDVVEFYGPHQITADDWAAWNDTIAYELLTSVGNRVPRRYVGAGS